MMRYIILARIPSSCDHKPILCCPGTAQDHLNDLDSLFAPDAALALPTPGDDQDGLG